MQHRSFLHEKALNREDTFAIIQRIAWEANVHLWPDEHIHVSPHSRRHTLLRTVTTEKGVHYAMELSSHRPGRYIWR